MRGLGEEFLLPRGFIKIHACGRYIHGALDCVETLMARRPLPPESIRAIRVRTYAMAASLGHADVRSEFGARFSLPFAVASLLCHGRSGLDNYGAAAVADPRIQALARRVAVAEDPDFTRAFPGRQPTEVTVVFADGTQMSEHADFHRGEAEHPHPPEAVRRSSSTWPRRSGGRGGRRRSTTACSTSRASPTWRPWPGTRGLAPTAARATARSPCSADSTGRH